MSTSRSARIRHVALASSLICGSITAIRQTTAAAAGTGLHVQGNQLWDGNTAVVLHGVNRSGPEYACRKGPSFADGPTDAASLRPIAAWHLNAIRIPLNEDCWLGINGVAIGGATYQRDIVGWVQTITDSGMYAILDLHWSAPGAVQAEGQQPMADADHAPDFWNSVASTFKANGRAIFDLYNEPDPLPYSASYRGGFTAWQNADFACLRDGCFATSTQGTIYRTVGMQALVDTVRATGAGNLIMVGGIQDAQTITQYLGDAGTPGSYLPHDPAGNLAVSTHIYAHDACGDLSCWTHTVAPVAARYPVIAGEFGDTDCSSRLTDVLLPWLDMQSIGYVAWNWGTDFGCQSLIRDYTGTPSSPFGQSYNNHLAALPGTPLPPTGTPTPISPTATNSPVQPSATGTALPTATTAPPTSTATYSPVPPSATSTPIATGTARPTATGTPPLPTATRTLTAPTATSTLVPSTSTSIPVISTMTGTPVPQTATATRVPPSATAVEATRTATAEATAGTTPNSLAGTFNNVGIASDGHSSAGNFDGLGNSYSSEGLRAAGLNLGRSFDFNGIHFPLDGVAPAVPDDSTAQGQRLQLRYAGGTRLAFLGAAHDGPASGSGFITYADGTVQPYTLTFSDWTLNAGRARPSAGSEIAVTTTYRNRGEDGHHVERTYLFYTDVQLLLGRTPVSVTLPTSHRVHVFALALDTPFAALAR